MPKVEKFRIENDEEADVYLEVLQADPKKYSLDEVRAWVGGNVDDEALKAYILEQAESILRER